MRRRRVPAGTLALFLLLWGGCEREEARFHTGLEVLQSQGFFPLKGKRVGVITNPTGVDRSLKSLAELLSSTDGVTLAALFAPEHGAAGSSGAGETVSDRRDQRSGVPIYSLYGKVRRPTKEMLDGIDVLIFDIQDIGVRTYTYLSTLGEALEAAAESHIELWVLDRPVPVGAGRVEGPVLEEALESFVGHHPVPLRHGLTVGEFALMVNEERRLDAKLQVVRMEGYRRDVPYENTGLIWISPSPNIPTLDAALAYAGMVLIEGTNVSEGRGTTRPFQLLGAPWVDGDGLSSRLNSLGLPGCRFRSVLFVPTTSKYKGEECGGVELHMTDRRAFEPVTAAVALLEAVRLLYPGKLEIRAEPFDRLAGTASLREALERGTPFREIVKSWQAELAAYRKRREKFLLYR